MIPSGCTLRFAILCTVVALGVGVDQLTKHWASSWLADSVDGRYHHTIYVTVAEEQSVFEALRQSFPADDKEDLRAVARSHSRLVDGGALAGDEILQPGSVIEISHRRVRIIPGYFELQYARNPGALFGFGARLGDEIRRLVFIVLVVVLILGLSVMVVLSPAVNLVSAIAWSMIIAGASGNLIDRLRYDFVVDFIVWKIPDVYRWPTFNLADVWITCGAILVLVEMIRALIRGEEGDD